MLPYRLMMPGTVAPKFRFRGKGKMSIVQGHRNRGAVGRVGGQRGRSVIPYSYHGGRLRPPHCYSPPPDFNTFLLPCCVSGTARRKFPFDTNNPTIEKQSHQISLKICSNPSQFTYIEFLLQLFALVHNLII